MAKKNAKNKQNAPQNRASKKETGKKEKKESLLHDIEEQKNKVEERKQEIDKRFSKKEQEIEETRRKMVKNIFKLMQDVGVDPSNPKDIRSFLTELDRQNPDLLELFESAFTGLLEEDVAYQENQTGQEEQEEGSPKVGLEKKDVPQFPSLKGLGRKDKARGSGEPEKTTANPAQRAAELPKEEQQKEEPIKDFNTLRDAALKS